MTDVLKQEVYSRDAVMHCKNERFVMFKEELAGVTTNFEPVDRFENMRDMRGFVNVDSSTSKIILSIPDTVCLRLRKIEVGDAAVKFIAMKSSPRPQKYTLKSDFKSKSGFESHKSVMHTV